MVRKET
jgi:hypothetical protein